MTTAPVDIDLEAILAVTGADPTDPVHAVADNADAIFTWDYDKGKRPALNKLYEKAKTSMWNGSTDLDWDTPVDPEAVAMQLNSVDHRAKHLQEILTNAPDSPLQNWGDKEWLEYGMEAMNWRLSQFLHGEQGALVCTAKIVETVPWIDAKYYAAAQVMDEARHVEVFARYLDEKLTGHYPMNAHLQALIDDIVQDSRWDITYLGMQIMVEGLALAAFGSLHRNTTEPLLKKLLRYVMSDEARHVAFGVLSLQEVYTELSEAELLERQEFALDAAIRMRDRFLQQEVWERMGVDVPSMIRLMLAQSGETNEFQQLLFAKVVPNCKKMGLLDAGGTIDRPSWLRKKFTEIGIIQFEDAMDTSEEYALLDEVSKDRDAGIS